MKTWRMAAIFFLTSWAIIAGCEKESKEDNAATVSIPHIPLSNPAALDSLVQQIGDARIVMLGEATHGTHEFYQWRAEISKRLIADKGFTMIAVEGEWADSYRLNQFIQGPAQDSTQAVQLLRQYDRWPTWMWGNYEIASLATWLNQHNQQTTPQQKAGFYGLDVYCLWESMQELLPYVQDNATLKPLAQQVAQCFRPYSADPIQYASAVAQEATQCRSQTENLWNAVMQQTGSTTATTEASFVMQQNALVALNGERYYRAAANSYPDSWNIRDRHMEQTLERLLDWKGPEAKIIVWAHNTHVGDARYTDMAGGGMVNLGQLAREKFGENNVFLVGFGTYSGQVIASDEWGGAIQTMKVPQAQKGSWEAMLHGAGGSDKLLLSTQLAQTDTLKSPIGHRAIGVQYDPRNERGNYVPTVIPKRYDAFIFIDRTTALRPLGTSPRNEPPDTYPSGY